MKHAPTPLAKRLQTIMKEMRWNQSDLARAAGCARQSVSSWMHGDNENIHPRFALNLQDATKFNARWIMFGEGEPRIRVISPSEEQLLAKIRELPQKRREALRLILDLADSP